MSTSTLSPTHEHTTRRPYMRDALPTQPERRAPTRPGRQTNSRSNLSPWTCLTITLALAGLRFHATQTRPVYPAPAPPSRFLIDCLNSKQSTSKQTTPRAPLPQIHDFRGHHAAVHDDHPSQRSRGTLQEELPRPHPNRDRHRADEAHQGRLQSQMCHDHGERQALTLHRHAPAAASRHPRQDGSTQEVPQVHRQRRRNLPLHRLESRRGTLLDVTLAARRRATRTPRPRSSK